MAATPGRSRKQTGIGKKASGRLNRATSRKPPRAPGKGNGKKRMRRKGIKDPTSGARSGLRQFRQASILAVVLTAFLLMMLDAVAGQQDTPNDRPDTVALIEELAVEDLLEEREEEAAEEEIPDVAETAGEALNAVKDMYRGFLRVLPRFLIGIAILVFIWLLVRGVNAIINKVLGHWERTEAITTLVAIILWLTGIGLVMSIIAGDIRALIGSLGLVGLALSWALQSPIESGTGWLLNKFKGYYRVGDRIVVGDVFGDVYKIDFINTTLWEIGDPFSGGFVNAEQPTGRLVTFPNSEILNGIVVNLTADYPYVWDELAVAVANESDLGHAMKALGGVADDLLAGQMVGPAREYERILQRARLEQKVSPKPELFLASKDSWTDVVIRYLVPARERRKWKSELLRLTTEELNKPDHQGRVIAVYPRQQVQFIDREGRPVEHRPEIE